MHVIQEIEALFALKRSKDNQLLGALIDAPPKKPQESESLLAALLLIADKGALDYQLMQEMEQLILRERDD